MVYFILVEIAGYRQLVKLRPNVVREVERVLTNEFLTRGGVLEPAESGCILARFEKLTTSDQAKVAESLVAARDELLGRADDLSGFSVLLDQCAAGCDDESLRRMRDILTTLPVDDAAWITRHASLSMAVYLEYESDGPALRVVGRTHDTGGNAGRIESFAATRLKTEELLDALFAARDGGLIVVQGSDADGLDYAIDAAVSSFVGPKITALDVRPRRIAEYPFSPLETVVGAFGLNETPHFLNSAERAVWESRSALLEYITKREPRPELFDAAAHDFRIAFMLFLRSYARRAESVMSAPCLVIRSIDRIATPALELLRACLDDVGGFVVIASSAEEVPVVFHDVQHATVYASDVTPAEIEDFVKDAGWSIRPSETAAILRSSNGKRLSAFHSICLLVGRHAQFADGAPTRHVIENLEREPLFALYAGSLLDGSASLDEYYAILEPCGVDPSYAPEILKELATLGLIPDETLYTPTEPSLIGDVKRLLGPDSGNVELSVVRFAEQRVARGGPKTRWFGILEQFGSIERTMRVFRAVIDRSLDRGDLATARELLYHRIPFGDRAVRPSEIAILESILFTGRLRLALVTGETATARRIISAWDSESIGTPSTYGDVALAQARYRAAIGDYREAAATAKRSIMAFQDQDDPRGVSTAYIEFARILLASENVTDAREYFAIAATEAHRTGDPWPVLRAAFFEYVGDFLYGDYSQALARTERCIADADEIGAREYSMYSSFVHGRIFFELGLYDEALDTFSRVAAIGRAYGRSDVCLVGRTWVARTHAYRGEFDAAQALLETIVPSFASTVFRGEAALLAGEYRCALEHLEAAGAHREDLAETPVPDRPSWRDGFEYLEDTAIGVVTGGSVLSRVRDAYYGYALSELGRGEEAIGILYDLVRVKKPSDHDPYTRLYCFLYSEVLNNSNSRDADDRATILGKAVKSAQERTTRIEKHVDRTAFMTRNYWNITLVERARLFNLV